MTPDSGRFRVVMLVAAGLMASTASASNVVAGCVGNSAGPCEAVGFGYSNPLGASYAQGSPSGITIVKSQYTGVPQEAASSLSFATSSFGTLVATATSADAPALATQDWPSVRGEGGLGVTSTSGGAPWYVDGSDVLTLTFSNTVGLDVLDFVDSSGSVNCPIINGGVCGFFPGTDALTSSTKFLVSVDGGAKQGFALGNDSAGNNQIVLPTPLIGKSFAFSIDSSTGATPYYLQAIEVSKSVPESSMRGFLAWGLMALIGRPLWLARRRPR